MLRFTDLKHSILLFLFLQVQASAMDIDVFGGSGNISASTANEKRASDGSRDKAWTPFFPYESAANIGLRVLQTFISEQLNGQLGAEFSYFTASAKLPADRIVERYDFITLISQGRQAMTNDDRIRIETGRAGMSLGFSIPFLPDRLEGEFGLIAGVGVGRVRDSVNLQSSGAKLDSYTSKSVHWAVSLRIRLVLSEHITTGIEYRYSEEAGGNFSSNREASVSYRTDSNLFMVWLGYRFEKKP